MTAKHYNTKFGLLAISDSTIDMMSRSGESSGMLINHKPELQRLEVLGDFCHFEQPKNGVNIGTWLHNTHVGLSAQPSFIGSHVVDEAANAVKSVEELKWMSREERPQPITSGTCIAHKSTTSGGMASGTSGHKYNMNPHSGEQLTKLHSHIVKINRSGTRKAILKDVRKEEKRTEFTSVQPSVVTCWSSSHDECVRANQNQYDLNETINRLISEHGLDKDIFEEHMDTYGNLNNAIILSENWDFSSNMKEGYSH